MAILLIYHYFLHVPQAFCPGNCIRSHFYSEYIINWDIQSWKMGKGIEAKEDECAFIVGMAKGGATIS